MTDRFGRLSRWIGLTRGGKRHVLNPVVPPGGVTGTALTVVIAIMTFLACLAVGGVNLIGQQAKNWESQVSREATIQIRPVDGQDMQAALIKAVQIVRGFEGVSDARIVDIDATKRMLEPWLGSGLDFNDLPIPRLIVVTLSNRHQADFKKIAETIQSQIPGGSFDDHQTWVDRLVGMARASVLIGLAILILVLTALSLTVVFATRGSLSGNAPIVEVLHFIGAENRFVARQFDFHFLHTGLRGALYGGISAVVLFFLCSLWSSRNMARPEADQLTALFGNFTIGWQCYAEMVGLVLFVAALTMLTSRITVIRQLRMIDNRQTDLF